MPASAEPRARARLRVLTAACLAAALGAAVLPAVRAAELDSVRLRAGHVAGIGDIDGGGLAVTFTPSHPPGWLLWPGRDLHVEAALSVWHDAAPEGDVHTAHVGPIWHHEPAVLGPRGFVEFGTSVAWISEDHVEMRDLGSQWHFTTHVSLGLRLGARERWHAALRLRHTSNAGLASPNPGFDISMFELGYTLDAGRSTGW